MRDWGTKISAVVGPRLQYMCCITTGTTEWSELTECGYTHRHVEARTSGMEGMMEGDRIKECQTS